MNPFFFGTSARQLYGSYEPAVSSGRGHGVVLCPAFADEYLYAHGAFRLLARQLSAANLDVLRFDYFGTGDSAGDFEEASADQWLADIRTAVAELKDIAQVSRVSIVGLRYGATLAAQAARTRSDVDGLVLWDPIFDGEGYLTEIGAYGARSEIVDAHGVSVTPSFREDIAAVTLSSFAAPLPRTLVMSSAANADGARTVADRLSAEDVDVEFVHVPDANVWGGSSIGAAALPVTALKRIVAWLS